MTQPITKKGLTDEIPVCKFCEKVKEWKSIIMWGTEKGYWFATCSCESDYEKKMEQEKADKENVERYLKSGIPVRFKDVSFLNADMQGINRDTYNKIMGEWLKALGDNNANNKGLFLHGSYGTGKTYLVICLAREIYFNYNKGFKFYSVPALLEKTRSSFNHNEDEDVINPMEDLTSYPPNILFLDDIGKEKPSDWVREQLYILINSRYENLLPTIFTSNCNAKELSNNLGEAIISRIYEMCDIYTLKGEDRRKIK